MNRVMILGGYGHFGVKIAEALIKDYIPIIIVGRSQDKLTKAIDRLKQKFPTANVAGSCFDIYKSLNDKLKELKPFIVIHTRTAGNGWGQVLSRGTKNIHLFIPVNHGCFR